MNEDAVFYGELSSEARAHENETCRSIVHEVTNFGVSQRQQLMIIYLLAMELENVGHMQTLTSLIRELAPDVFLIGSPSDEVR